MGRVAFLREIATVRVSAGRRCGKTTYALNNAKNAVIVYGKKAMRVIYEGSVAPAKYVGDCTPDDFRNKETIYIDEPALFDPRDLNKLFQLMARHSAPNAIIVALGE